jgi:branched-subunit amino acid ABC-type transport system permease component
VLEVNIAQLLINTILSGSVYTILSLGLVLVYSILKFANFAHAEYITLGAYFAYVVNVLLSLNLILGIAVAFIATGIVAIFVDRLCFKPLRARNSGPVPMMIVSIGVGLALRHILQVMFGSGILWYNLPEVKSYHISTGTISDTNINIIFASLVLVFCLHLLLTKTKLGKAMRATSDNPTLSMTFGIDTERIIIWVWFISAGVAGVAGVLWGANTRIMPYMGWELLLSTFAVVILGGMGSFYGAILASYILGFAENLGVVLFINLSISTSYRPVIAFIVLILVLLIRPKGLLGRQE